MDVHLDLEKSQILKIFVLDETFHYPAIMAIIHIILKNPIFSDMQHSVEIELSYLID